MCGLTQLRNIFETLYRFLNSEIHLTQLCPLSIAEISSVELSLFSIRIFSEKAFEVEGFHRQELLLLSSVTKTNHLLIFYVQFWCSHHDARLKLKNKFISNSLDAFPNKHYTQWIESCRVYYPFLPKLVWPSRDSTSQSLDCKQLPTPTVWHSKISINSLIRSPTFPKKNRHSILVPTLGCKCLKNLKIFNKKGALY